jgi:hypothetical protein
MQERRKLKRQPVSYYMQITDGRTQEIVGHLLDITPRGMMIDSRTPLPAGRSYHLRVETTADVSDTSHIEFIARGVWCKRDAIEPYLYDIGLEITNITPHDAAVIRRIMETYGIGSRSRSM